MGRAGPFVPRTTLEALSSVTSLQTVTNGQGQGILFDGGTGSLLGNFDALAGECADWATSSISGSSTGTGVGAGTGDLGGGESGYRKSQVMVPAWVRVCVCVCGCVGWVCVCERAHLHIRARACVPILESGEDDIGGLANERRLGAEEACGGGVKLALREQGEGVSMRGPAAPHPRPRQAQELGQFGSRVVWCVVRGTGDGAQK